jgi:ER membrane protein complex subunit 4
VKTKKLKLIAIELSAVKIMSSASSSPSSAGQQQNSSIVSTTNSSSSSALLTGSKSYRQRKWFIDLTRKPEKYSGPAQSSELTLPVGYVDRPVPDMTNVEEGTRLIGMRSWDIALGPIKQAPMNVMISWMAGNSIALFPIMFVGMLLFRPLQSIFSMSKAFEAIEVGQYSFIQKLVYLLGNFVNLGIALYKCHSMGLLPTYASDWLAFADPQERMEYSFGGFALN